MKKSKKLSFKFTIYSSLDIFIVQPNFVINGIVFKLYNVIIDLFSKFLSMIEVFSIYSH